MCPSGVGNRSREGVGKKLFRIHSKRNLVGSNGQVVS